MVRGSGKAKKIHERIMGSPRNEHLAHDKDPRIRESDKARVMLALMTHVMNQGQNGPQNQDMGMQ
jgi:hypothetical protein